MLMSNTARPARLHYLMNGFRVLAPGDHVLCAITSVPIPLDELRSWCVEKQQAYANAEVATRAFASQ